MAYGILILGLNGCGKTTVGRMLAQYLGWKHMDAEDYFFPVRNDHSISRTKEEVHRLMEADAKENFVLSSVQCSASEKVLVCIRLAVVLRATPELRAKRIQQREKERYGNRILPGGDLYKSHCAFADFAANRTEEAVNQTLYRLNCPVIEIDAALPVDKIIELIQKQDA